MQQAANKQPQYGKGSKRRSENFKTIQNNWDEIDWGKKVIPKWVCSNCGYIKNKEEEIVCWKCGKGDMIYSPIKS
jgi:rubrerythrin